MSDSESLNSPQKELAELFYKNGVDWLKNNYKNTKYFLFQKSILKIKPYVPMKKIHLFESLQRGYLRDGHERDHIVILNDPLLCTRYGSKLSLPSPEIFMGHHRVGGLLALGIKEAEVIIAADRISGHRTLYGNLHEEYIKICD